MKESTLDGSGQMLSVPELRTSPVTGATRRTEAVEKVDQEDHIERLMDQLEVVMAMQL